MVTNQDVIAGIALDVVARGAAKDEVITVVALDRVSPASIVRIIGVNQIDCSEVAIKRHVVEYAVIAQDDVVAHAAVDEISSCAAEDDVIAVLAIDVVRAARIFDRGLDSLDVSGGLDPTGAACLGNDPVVT